LTNLTPNLELNYKKNSNLIEQIVNEKKISVSNNLSYKHFLPSNKEWSSSIYSFNKNNLILAPQINQTVYKFSKSYLNSSPKQSLIDNILILKKKSDMYNKSSNRKFIKENMYSKMIFPITNFKKLESTSQNNTDILKFIANKNDISKRKRDINLYIFRKNFGIDSLLEKKVSPFLNRGKELVYKKKNQENITSYIQNFYSAKKTYSTLKTFIGKPEIKYTSNNIFIDLYIYNRKNKELLRKLKKNFQIIRPKIKKSLSFNLRQKQIKNDNNYNLKRNNIRIKKNFFNKLSAKSSISFFIYLWRHLKVKSNKKNIFLYNIFLMNKLNFVSSPSSTSYLYKDLKSSKANINCKLQTRVNLPSKILSLFMIKNQEIKNNEFIIKTNLSLWTKVIELLSNMNLLENKKKLSIIKKIYNKYSNLIKNSKRVLNRQLAKENNIVYGFKPFTNMFYFKHNLMLYYFEFFKRNNNNLLPLKNIFMKIFLKKITFTIINLKYWKLDSQIIADIITTKLMDRTKKVLNVLKRSLYRHPKFYNLPSGKVRKENEKNSYFWKQRNLFFGLISNNLSSFVSGDKEISKANKTKNLNLVINKSEYINSRISNSHIFKFTNKYKNHLLLNNLQNKWKLGTRYLAKGRITKRKTAERSLSKTRYIGPLENLLSSKGGISTSLSRGIIKSNLQYTINNGNNANGSFGLKVYISSLQTLQKWDINS
jgi:hypothetical protein